MGAINVENIHAWVAGDLFAQRTAARFVWLLLMIRRLLASRGAQRKSPDEPL